MSARPMLSHVKTSDGRLVLMPVEIVAATIAAGVRHSDVASKWQSLEDLESKVICKGSMDVIITNPPYSKTYNERNAAGKRILNPNYWQKVIPLAYESLKEGGVLILIAPITPNVAFNGFELIRQHVEEAVEFVDTEGNNVYTKSCWVELRKRHGSKSRIHLPEWASFGTIQLTYGNDVIPQGSMLMDLSSCVVTDDLSKYNTNKVVLVGPATHLRIFKCWSESDEGKAVLYRIRGNDYMRVSIARARLGMKK